MFGVSNSIAYDGLMINGANPGNTTRFRKKYPSARLPETKWTDIVSEASEGHWIPAEGQQLDVILRTLAMLNFDMSQVMVIGPFRDVARRPEERAERYPGLVAGTIHTAQGKQTDIVAVSRAKRRLYVLGDRQAWSGKQHFAALADRLPHTSPRS